METQRNWGLLIAAGIFVLVAALILWLALPDSESPEPIVERYGPWQFRWEPPFWVTQYRMDDQTYNLRFRYLPGEVDNITVRGTNARLISPFYLSFDPMMSNESKVQVALAFSDSSAKLQGIYGETPIAACTTNETDPACANVPSITCSANSSAFVFTEATQPSVTLDGTCIRIQGTGEDLYRAETLMWYRLLDIVR